MEQASTDADDSAVMRCEPAPRALAGPLAVVLVTEAVFVWSMVQGYLDTYWLLGALAIGALAGYIVLMLVALQSTRLGAELRDGEVVQLGGPGRIDLDAVARVEYRPIHAEVVVADRNGREVKWSLFAQKAGTILSEVVRERGSGLGAVSFERTTMHVVGAVAFVALAVTMVALFILRDEVSAFTWSAIVLVPAAAAIISHLAAARRLSKEHTALVVASLAVRREVSLGEAPRLHIRMKVNGEFWPRIECFVAGGGSQESRVPASGLNLLALISLLGCEPTVE